MWEVNLADIIMGLLNINGSILILPIIIASIIHTVFPKTAKTKASSVYYTYSVSRRFRETITLNKL